MKNVHKKTAYELFVNNGTKVFALVVGLANFNFFFGDKIHPVPENWGNHIRENCVDIPLIDAETENYVRFNLALTLMGTYLGLIVE